METDGRTDGRTDGESSRERCQTEGIRQYWNHTPVDVTSVCVCVLQYDNILMEEAAQILEIETFIPLLLQVSLSLFVYIMCLVAK